jgi:hypothetical protein
LNITTARAAERTTVVGSHMGWRARREKHHTSKDTATDVRLLASRERVLLVEAKHLCGDAGHYALDRLREVLSGIDAWMGGWRDGSNLKEHLVGGLWVALHGVESGCNVAIDLK